MDADIYNFNKTGFIIDQISTGIVVTSSNGRIKAKKIQPGNREWITVVQAVNSTGYTIPPYLIVAGKTHLDSWYNKVEFPLQWHAGVFQNGWTTNKLAIDWIHHFEEFTAPQKLGVYRLLVLDGHESHHSDKFEEYYKAYNIITLYMPLHSFYIL